CPQQPYIQRIVIENPSHSGIEYFNYRKRSQGRINDEVIFNNSVLWQSINRKEMNFPSPCPMTGSDIRRRIIKSYLGRKFNKILPRSRVIVEITFVIISSIFRIFRRTINLNLETVSKIITMACVLTTQLSTKKYLHPPGSFVVYDNRGTLVTPGSWRRPDNKYNTMQTIPSFPRRSPLNAQQIREEL
ncbi:hypothetical protein HW555_008936, partial [Spodoptera exigua]